MKRLRISVPFIVGIVLILSLLTACFNGEKEGTDIEVQERVALTQIAGEYTLDDMTDFGLWSVSLPRVILNDKIKPCEDYVLTINNLTYNIRPNKVNNSILMCLLPESLSKEAIQLGEISEMNPSIQTRQIPLILSIEKLIIVGEETRNGTNTYELLLTDYVDFKTSNAYLIFDDNDNLIRPSYIKSIEENAYTLKRYYDARQITRGSVEDALDYLKTRDNHESLLFFGNANRVSFESTITYQVPDDRDRIRQLGSRGALNGSNTFNIVDDASNDQFVLSFDQTQLPVKYAGTSEWLSQFKEATELNFTEAGPSNIYEMSIPYSDAPSTECVLNARFAAVNSSGPVTFTQGETTGEYDTISDAVAAIDASSSDPVTLVLNNALYQEGQQVSLSNIQPVVTIQAANGVSPAINGQDTHRLFYIEDSSTITFKGLTFKDGNTGISDGSNCGGAVYCKGSNLDIQSCTFASNTAVSPPDGTSGAGFAGALYFYSTLVGGQHTYSLLISDSVFDGNGVTGDRGNWGGAVVISFCKDLRIEDSIFKNNVLTGSGAGAIHVQNVYGTATIKNCVISNNTANAVIFAPGVQFGGDGAGIYTSAQVNIENCTITHNTASFAGGGICAKTEFEITSGLIAENTAAKFGGGICIVDDDYGDPEVITTSGHVWVKSGDGTSFLKTAKDFAINSTDGKAYEYEGENPNPNYPVQVRDNLLTDQTKNDSKQYYTASNNDFM